LTATRAYDSLGRLDVITNVTSLSQTVSSHDYTYDAAHRRTHALREDGTTWNYAYNDRDEVVDTERVLPGGGAALRSWSRAYAYDAIGNRLSASEGGESGAGSALTQAYTPNALNQYAEISYPSQLAILGKAETDATVTVNAQSTNRQSDGSFHALLSASNSTGPDWLPVEVEATRTVVPQGNVDTLREGSVFMPPALLEPTYDSDGNLTFDGRWTYSWDGENRLIAQETSSAAATVGVPLQRIEHHYDARSRRFRKVVQSRALATDPWQTQSNELFIYDDYWNPVALIDSATGQAKQLYVWGNDVSGDMRGAGGVGGLLTTIDLASQESQAWNYAYDEVGNVMALVDVATGSCVARYEYDAFGDTVLSQGDLADLNRWRHSTKWVDLFSNLTYFGYRHYNLKLGRFLSKDPIGEKKKKNLYSIASNKGSNALDILGLTERVAGEEWEYLGLPSIQNAVKKGSPQNNIMQSANLPGSTENASGKWAWGFYIRLHEGPAFQNCEARVVVPVKPEAGTNHLLTANVQQNFENGVTETWDDKFKLVCTPTTSKLHKGKQVCCPEYHIRVKLSFEKVWKNHHILELFTGPGKITSREWSVDNPTSAEPPLSNQEVAAHETGHLLGNPDEYYADIILDDLAAGGHPGRTHYTNHSWVNGMDFPEAYEDAPRTNVGGKTYPGNIMNGKGAAHERHYYRIRDHVMHYYSYLFSKDHGGFECKVEKINKE